MRYIISKYSNLALLFVITLGVKAQPMLFEHINEKQGLSQNSVHSIVQDEQGFLWMGTDDGLNRFDGYEFDIYRSSEKNAQSILAGKINNLNCNHAEIALLTEIGISLFNTKTFESDNFLFPKNLRNPRLVFHLGNHVLVGADNGLFILNPLNGEFNATQITDPITAITKLKQGVIAIGVSSGLYLFYPFNKKIVALEYSPDFYIMALAVGENKTLHWVESNGIAFSGMVQGNKIKIIRKTEIAELGTCTSLCVYGNDLMIGTPHGLIRLTKQEIRSDFKFNENEPYSLSANRILCLYADVHKNLWAGTISGGLNKYHPHRFKFPCIGPAISSRFNQFKDLLAFSETGNGNIIYSNSAGELGTLDLTTQSITSLHQTDLTINAIYPANADSTLFLLGTPKGLYTYAPTGQKLTKLNTINAIKPLIMDAKSIIKFKDQQFWIAGGDGVFLYDLKEEKTLSYFGIGNSRLGSNNIRSILLGKPNELLLATAAGLYSLNLDNQIITQVKLTREKKEPFVSQLAIDQGGNCWIGSVNQGIFRLNRDHTVDKWNTGNGIANNNIYGIIPVDEMGEIWFSTNAGISRYNTKTCVFNNYDIYDGLQGNEFIESSLLKMSGGKLVFGGINGFNYFDPPAIKNDTENCNVVIKKLLAFNSEEPYQTYYNFDYQKNYLTVEFVALDFNLAGSNQYYYKMEGLQNNWTEAGNRRFASFGQLQTGNYIFKVRATNGDGKLSNKETEIQFSIVPPFWLTWWFRIGMIVLLSGCIALFIYSRVNSVIEEEQEKTRTNKMMAELELKALRAQMNPHFIFNSLNSIQDFVLNNEGVQNRVP